MGIARRLCCFNCIGWAFEFQRTANAATLGVRNRKVNSALRGDRIRPRKTSMKIAQVPPLYESVPPKLYGGTERVVSILCDTLVELGHEVTLFGTAEANTKANLVATRDRAIRLDPHPLKSDLAAHLAMLHEVRMCADEFDVIHFHVDLLHMPMFESMPHRTLTTLHGRLDIRDLAEAYRRWNSFPLVAISDNHRATMPEANWVATVHHGLPVGLITPPPEPKGDYLAFLGRISPEKGPARAIEIAKKVGMKIKIAAKVDRADKEYFERTIRPLMNDQSVDFIGEISDEEKSDFLGNAAAVLFPIAWPEPFGLVMIEAMAAGAPVIATPCGSVPEIVTHGCTGFIVNTVEDAASAVLQSSTLDRHLIRKSFEERFSAEIMARKYLELYWRAGISSSARAIESAAS
jgi:glycosyltransferase involved in cell wall biosynthesis